MAFLEKAKQILEYSLVTVGEQEITLKWIALLLLLLLVVRLLTKAIAVVLERSLHRGGLDRRSIKGFSRLAQVVAGILGLIIVLDVLGLNISAFLAMFAALGIGIGFGLQNIANNIVSSAIVLFERPIRPGDYIEVDGCSGEVKSIGMRATRMIDNDGIEVVIPNSKILENSLTNWTLTEPIARIAVPFGVHYQSDPHQVRSVAMVVAESHSAVLKKPEPVVQFLEFGDSSLNFRLLVWIREPWGRLVIASELRYALFDALKDANIEIPYPQRDLHIRSSSVAFGQNLEREESQD